MHELTLLRFYSTQVARVTVPTTCCGMSSESRSLSCALTAARSLCSSTRNKRGRARPRWPPPSCSTRVVFYLPIHSDRIRRLLAWLAGWLAGSIIGAAYWWLVYFMSRYLHRHHRLGLRIVCKVSRAGARAHAHEHSLAAAAIATLLPAV